MNKKLGQFVFPTQTAEKFSNGDALIHNSSVCTAKLITEKNNPSIED